MRRFYAISMIIGILFHTTIIQTTHAKDNLIDDDEIIVAPDDNDNDQTPSTPIEDESRRYESPNLNLENYFFAEHFDDASTIDRKWIKSTAKKDDISDDIAKYDGVWAIELPQKPLLNGDSGLVLKSKAKHAAIAARLTKPFVFSDRPLVVQYEVQLQDGQECGGSYIKLLSSGPETSDLKTFNDKTPYTIMFGPDKCGNDIKLHFIFRHVNPLNGTITEKHCRKSKDRLEEPFKDKQPHLYQLVIQPDNSYSISVDHKIMNEGSLLTDFAPPVNPPKEIDDPNDHKPVDWDERERIADPDASKPDDWDEDAPAQIPDSSTSKPDGWIDDEEVMIPDPTAIKPDDWDTDMDGDWEAPLINNPKCEAVGCGTWSAPMIPNPNYKGKWRAPLIDNPNYQGKWAPRKIQNPEFFEDLSPFRMTTIAAVGIELWSMSSDILFDNVLITDRSDMADSWAAQTFDLKHALITKEANTLYERAMKHTNDKLGWWALYFFYCTIPIALYAWYLSRRAKDKEETFVASVIRFTHDNPYMWAVYVICGGLPFAFLLYFCFSSAPKEKAVDLSAKAKKSDLSQPDVKSHADNVNIGAAGDAESLLRNTKSELNEPAEVEEIDSVDGEDDEDVEDEDENEKIEDKPEVQELQKDDVLSEGAAAISVSTEGTRKRKPRKD